MYKASISTDKPAAIIFVVDQSGSMGERVHFEGKSCSKAEVVAQMLNMAMYELVCRCTGYQGVLNYFWVAVIGYGGFGIRPLLHSSMKFVSISQIYRASVPKMKYHRDVTQANGKAKVFTSLVPQWIQAHAEGHTPMVKALDAARRLAVKFSKDNEDSFPVMVFNITDGGNNQSGKQELHECGKKLKEVATKDGNLLLFNVHISSNPDTHSVIFPSDDKKLRDVPYGKLLYEIASPLPKLYHHLIDNSSEAEYKAMSFNASFHELFYMLNIGSITKSILR